MRLHGKSLSRLSPPARSPSSRQLQFDSVRDEIFSSHYRSTSPPIYGVAASKWKQLCDDFRHTFAREVKPGDEERRFQVHFLGVWDTVSSVGWVWDPKHFPFTAYNPSVKHIRHAVAIDERRAFFRQNLFRPAPGQDVLELWFPGVHSDIGGGGPPEGGRLW